MSRTKRSLSVTAPLANVLCKSLKSFERLDAVNEELTIRLLGSAASFARTSRRGG